MKRLPEQLVGVVMLAMRFEEVWLGVALALASRSKARPEVKLGFCLTALPPAPARAYHSCEVFESSF